MATRPTSSQRRLFTPPPPSQALLNLHKHGLELSASQSQTSLYSTTSHVSGKSTASDRDKPLPLEPLEKKRRSSSVYSTDTTITNIIRMYNDYKELIESPAASTFHHPHAYRDTIAPLLIKRLSITRSPIPQPHADSGPSDSASNLSLRSAPPQANTASSDPKTVPSFMEFSRSLQERKNELVSPASLVSTDPRQAAYDQLAPPSPQVSSVELSLSVSRTPPLPEAMVASISDVEESDLLPPPLEMSSSGPPSPLSDDWEEGSEAPSSGSVEVANDQPGADASSNECSVDSLDGVFQSPVTASNKPWERTSLPLRKSLTEKEQERILSYASAKYPAMSGDGMSRKRSRNSSARSSLQHGVSSLLRSVSRAKGKEGPLHDDPFPERQLAIPATPYQVYGPEIWSEKSKKKQQQQWQQPKSGHKRGKSVDIVNAYQNGQSQFVGVIEGAKRKLTGRTSQKRRRKLKQSIVLVGPAATQGTIPAAKESLEEEEACWI